MNASKSVNLLPFLGEKEVEKILWDDYVLSDPEGRFCHLTGYKKVVKDTYGYKPFYFILEKNEKMVGLVPAFVCKSVIFGTKIVSQPFSEYGGMLAHELTEDDYEEVFEILGETMAERKVSLMEIHGSFGIGENIKEKYLFPVFSHHRAILRLDDKVDQIWEKRISYEVRKAVRKAERSKVICYQKVDPDMIANKFYPLFLTSMKRLGAPPHPLTYYMKCYQHLKDHLRIFWAEFEGEIIAALLGFVVGKNIHIINTVSDEKHWEKRPNDLCHWNFIKWGSENGYEVFDLGSVRYEGQRRYKEKWGAEFQKYSHYVFGRDFNIKKMKPKTFDSSSKSMAFLSSVWHKFVPLKATKFLGPIVRKQLAR
jgi:hypothetical protein